MDKPGPDGQYVDILMGFPGVAYKRRYFPDKERLYLDLLRPLYLDQS